MAIQVEGYDIISDTAKECNLEVPIVIHNEIHIINY